MPFLYLQILILNYFMELCILQIKHNRNLMHIIYGLQMVSEKVEFSYATDFSLILLKMIK